MNPPEPIFVFVSAADWDEACRAGYYRSASLATEGFVHASPREQLVRVANKFYAQVSDLRLLEIDTGKVAAEIRWEPATGGLYPHIYGPLNVDAVVSVTPWKHSAS